MSLIDVVDLRLTKDLLAIESITFEIFKIHSYAGIFGLIFEAEIAIIYLAFFHTIIFIFIFVNILYIDFLSRRNGSFLNIVLFVFLIPLLLISFKSVKKIFAKWNKRVKHKNEKIILQNIFLPKIFCTHS